MLNGEPTPSGNRTRTPVPFTRLDYADPALLEELLALVRGVAERGAFTLGEPVDGFEKEFASYCETEFAVGVSSGTEALALALRALEIGPGDEVIVPSNSFIATAEAVSAVGATPRLVDVDPESHLLTAEIVERNLTPSVRCVIPVHLFGATVEMDPIVDLAREAGRTRRRGRLPGARGLLPRQAGRKPRRDRLLQLLPDQEPRRLGRRGGGRHLRAGAGRARAAAARTRREAALPPPPDRRHRAHGRPPGGRAAAKAHPAGRLERRTPPARAAATRGAWRCGRGRRRASRVRPPAFPSRPPTTSITCSSCAASSATRCASISAAAGRLGGALPRADPPHRRLRAAGAHGGHVARVRAAGTADLLAAAVPGYERHRARAGVPTLSSALRKSRASRPLMRRMGDLVTISRGSLSAITPQRTGPSSRRRHGAARMAGGK